jgi:glycosyltransferase involved in cell wall biosynthesis
MELPLPRITLVTPSYQQAQFLERTIRSVLDQGYPDLEYFVLDGGSQDGSRDIIERYAHRLAYWTSEKDAGQSAAINNGLRRASGEVVGWLNSDDTLAPGSLWRLGRFYALHPKVDLLYGHTYTIDADDRVLRRMVSVPTDADELIHYTPNIFSQPGTTWRRHIHEQLGYLDESLQYTMDCDFWIRAAKRFTLRCLPTHLGNLRIHGATKSSSQRDPMALEMERLARTYRSRAFSPWELRAYRLRRMFKVLRDPRNWSYRLGLSD